MPKEKTSKSEMRKYMLVLDKFGLQAPFEFGKKEKKIVKALEENGSMDFLSLCDGFDMKPEKALKHVDSLVQKGAVEFKDDVVSLTLPALNYLHAKKKLRKSAKKFYRFLDALNEKELDEFMKLVDTFKVMPEEPTVEIEMEEQQEEAPAPKPAPRKVTPRKRTTRKRSAAKPRAKKAAEPKVEATPKEE